MFSLFGSERHSKASLEEGMRTDRVVQAFDELLDLWGRLALKGGNEKQIKIFKLQKNIKNF